MRSILKTSGIIHFRVPTLQQSLLVTTQIRSSLNDCGIWELVNHLPTMTSNSKIVDLRSDPYHFQAVLKISI